MCNQNAKAPGGGQAPSGIPNTPDYGGGGQVGWGGPQQQGQFKNTNQQRMGVPIPQGWQGQGQQQLQTPRLPQQMQQPSNGRMGQIQQMLQGRQQGGYGAPPQPPRYGTPQHLSPRYGTPQQWHGGNPQQLQPQVGTRQAPSPYYAPPTQNPFQR